MRVTDSPEGFAAYMAMIETPIPEHAKGWVEKLYRARQEGKPGVVIEAHRGSAKTTTFSIGWLSFQLGLYPEGTNLVVGISDTAANEITNSVEYIISQNDGFRQAFPHVVPHPERGWGANGYWIKRDDVKPRKWAQKTGAIKDPSFLALGIMSGQLVGKHPRTNLIVDDLHDSIQVKSEAELQRVHDQVSGPLDKALTDRPAECWIGTPYHSDDVLQRRKAMDQYELIETPLYEIVDEETPGAVYDTDISEWILINWPEKYDLQYVQNQRARDEILSGGADFAKHMQLDLGAVSNRLFQFARYPADLVDPSWKRVITVDYASILGKATRYSDFFACCVAAKIPTAGGGLVIIDGVRRHVTQHEAELKLRALSDAHDPVIVGIEVDGKGAEFYDLMNRMSNIPVMPLRSRGRSKGERIERQLQPWVASGAIKLATDDRNEYIQGLLAEIVPYPHGKYDDCLDAAAYLPEVAADALSMTGLDLGGEELGRRQKPRTKGPYEMFGQDLQKRRMGGGNQQVGYSMDFGIEPPKKRSRGPLG